MVVGPGGDGAGDVEISLTGSDQDGQDHELVPLRG